jgi:hypothetical protein
MNSDTIDFGTAASRTLAAVPINASCAASRTVPVKKISLRKAAKAKASISTSPVTRTNHPSSSCIGTAHASAPSYCGLDTAPSSKTSGNNFSTTTSSGIRATSACGPATASNDLGTVTADAPATLRIGLGNSFIKEPWNGTNSAALAAAPTAGASHNGWEDSFATNQRIRKNDPGAAAHAISSNFWENLNSRSSSNGTNAEAVADTRGSRLGSLGTSINGWGSAAGTVPPTSHSATFSANPCNVTKVAAAAPAPSNSGCEIPHATNPSGGTNITPAIAPATSSNVLRSSIIMKPKRGAIVATVAPPLATKSWGAFTNPGSETNDVSATVAAATRVPWPSVKLSASSNDPCSAVSNANWFVFTPKSASDKKLTPVQESDYADTDHDLEDSKPERVDRSDQLAQFQKRAHASSFDNTDEIVAGNDPSNSAVFADTAPNLEPSPASSSKNSGRPPRAALSPASYNSTTAAYTGTPLPKATGLEYPEVMKNIMKDPCAPPEPNSNGSGKGLMPAERFSKLVEELQKGNVAKQITIEGNRVHCANVKCNPQMPLGLTKDGKMFLPASTLGSVIAGERTSKSLFDEFVKKPEKSSNAALTRFLRKEFYRPPVSMLNDPDFLESVSAGLLKHAAAFVAKHCAQVVEENKKRNAGRVSNFVQLSSLFPVALVDFIVGLGPTFSKQVDKEVDIILLSEHVMEAVKHQSLTDTWLEDLYKRSSELVKECFEIDDFKGFVREFAMTHLATEAAREFIIETTGSRNRRCLTPTNTSFLTDRFDSFDGLDWSNHIFKATFDCECTKLMPEDDPWNGAALARYLLHLERIGATDSVPAPSRDASHSLLPTTLANELARNFTKSRQEYDMAPEKDRQHGSEVTLELARIRLESTKEETKRFITCSKEETKRCMEKTKCSKEETKRYMGNIKCSKEETKRYIQKTKCSKEATKRSKEETKRLALDSPGRPQQGYPPSSFSSGQQASWRTLCSSQQQQPPQIFPTDTDISNGSPQDQTTLRDQFVYPHPYPPPYFYQPERPVTNHGQPIFGSESMTTTPHPQISQSGDGLSWATAPTDETANIGNGHAQTSTSTLPFPYHHLPPPPLHSPGPIPQSGRNGFGNSPGSLGSDSSMDLR